MLGQNFTDFEGTYRHTHNNNNKFYGMNCSTAKLFKVIQKNLGWTNKKKVYPD